MVIHTTRTSVPVKIITRLEGISDKAKASWDYFGFSRKGEWVAIRTFMGSVVVLDEGLELDTMCIFDDLDDFVRWLEQTADDRVAMGV